MRLAPNGDIFVAETSYGRVRALRLSADGNGVAQNEVFATGLNLPFGIAFYPRRQSAMGLCGAAPTRWCAFPTRRAT